MAVTSAKAARLRLELESARAELDAARTESNSVQTELDAMRAELGLVRAELDQIPEGVRDGSAAVVAAAAEAEREVRR